MLNEFSVLGSFASGSIFIKKINTDYDPTFHINYSTDRTTLISLMSEAIDYDEKLVNSKNETENISINQDLSKDFLDFLKDNNDTLDYLILDTLNDVQLGCIRLDDDTYITNSNILPKVDYYNLVKDYPQISLYDDFDEYFELWKRSCDEFFEFMKTNCPDIIIVLNLARLVYEYLDENGDVQVFNYFRKLDTDNEYKDLLDNYIMENHDVEILPFYDNYIDENHIYGLRYTHYEKKYFNDKNDQLNKIIERNNLFEFDDLANAKLREVERKELLFKRNYAELKKG